MRFHPFECKIYVISTIVSWHCNMRKTMFCCSAPSQCGTNTPSFQDFQVVHSNPSWVFHDSSYITGFGVLYGTLLGFVFGGTELRFGQNALLPSLLPFVP